MRHNGPGIGAVKPDVLLLQHRKGLSYTCSCGLRAAKLSPDTEDKAKQKTRNLHCTRPAQPVPSIRDAGSGIACYGLALISSVVMLWLIDFRLLFQSGISPLPSVL